MAGTRDLELTRSTSALKERASALIPAGSLSYSKGEDQFPENAPPFIDRAEGATAYDLDGRPFLDWAMGLRTVILGHCYPAVLDAVRAQLLKGSNFTRPSVLELELAELFVELIPNAEMVKFAKNGSDVTSAAIRLSRAFTGREFVALGGDGSFFSHDDWYIGSTLCNAGVPESTRRLTKRFAYNDLESLGQLFAEYPGQIAAVILEPTTTTPPAEGFLEGIRELTRREGAVLIFDEMITGFRWHLRGAQTYFGVTPDLSTFGKAIGNGFSLSALVGRRDIMELGGLRHRKEKVYALSCTHGGETHALAAALTTIREIRDRDVISHIWRIGKLFQNGFNQAAADAGISDAISMGGYACSPIVICRDRDGNVSLPFRTLFLQEMVERGVLIPYLTPSFAHTEDDVVRSVAAARETFTVYRGALERGVDHYLRGPSVKPVFRRFN